MFVPSYQHGSLEGVEAGRVSVPGVLPGSLEQAFVPSCHSCYGWWGCPHPKPRQLPAQPQEAAVSRSLRGSPGPTAGLVGRAPRSPSPPGPAVESWVPGVRSPAVACGSCPRLRNGGHSPHTCTRMEPSSLGEVGTLAVTPGSELSRDACLMGLHGGPGQPSRNPLGTGS